MASTTFEKPMGTEVETLKSDKQNKSDNTLQTTAKTVVGAVNELNSEMAYRYLPYKSGGSIGTHILNYINEGYKDGTFLALANATDRPGSSTNYRIRYTQNDGSNGITVEAWDYSDVSKYYVAKLEPSTGVVGTWNEFGLNSKSTYTIPANSSITISNLPNAYLLCSTTPSSTPEICGYIGGGYGMGSIRHKVVKLYGDNPAIIASVSETAYELIVTNNASRNNNVCLIKLS